MIFKIYMKKITNQPNVVTQCVLCTGQRLLPKRKQLMIKLQQS